MYTGNNRFGSVSSTESSSYTSNYDFSNLPSFASNKRNGKTAQNPQRMSDIGLSEHGALKSSKIASNTGTRREDLPFVVSKGHSVPINRLLSKESRISADQEQFDRKFSTALKNEENYRIPSSNEYVRKFSRDSLFGTRAWSTTSEQYRQSRNERNDYLGEKTDPKSGFGSSNEDTMSEFLDVLFNLGSLLVILFRKMSSWLLFLLQYSSAVLLAKIRKIPNPKFEKVEELEGDNDISIQEINFVESTPTKKMKFQDRHEKAPLFYKKLQEIEGPARDLNQTEKGNIFNCETKSENNCDTLVYRKDRKQYGTYFFNDVKRGNKNIDLESCYLKAASNYKKDLPPRDIYSRASDIKENLIKMYNKTSNNKAMLTHFQKPNDLLQKPTFTRSTARFQDLEWLVDDKEDYLNNLESTKLFKEYQKIIAERKKIEQLRHLAKLKEKGLGIKPLNDDQLSEVENIWNNKPDGVLSSNKGVRITSLDLFTLADRHWLNDNVIDFYLQMVKEEVSTQNISDIHVFTTFFYTTLKSKGYNGVKKWAKRAKVDVSELDYVFVPVNLNQTHWALAVIDNVNEQFRYVDSLSGDGTSILLLLQDYMIQETRKNHGDSLNGKNYNLYEIVGDVEDGANPTQQNGYDCGVFTCTAVDYLARKRPLDYSQADMPLLRRRMAYEILHGKLLQH